MIDSSVNQIVLVIGDSHGDIKHVKRMIEKAKRLNVKILLHVGDWGFLWRFKEELSRLNDRLVDAGMEMWWLDGNHENYALLADFGCTPDDLESTYIASNVKYLPRGFRFEIGNTSFMSFGGATSVDRYRRTPGTSWFREEAITSSQMAQAGSDPVDVFLSHDCPDQVDMLEAFLSTTAHFWPEDALRDSHWNRVLLGEVVDEVQPRLLIHGHYHHSYEGRRGPTRVIGLDCNGNPDSSYAFLDTEDLHVGT